MAKTTKTPEKSGGSWNPALPFQELQTLPPGGEIETKAVLKQCILSRAAVAELKQAAELIPNQGMLVNSLPLLEACSSSEIENIVTTTDRLFRFRGEDHITDAATKESLRYSYALVKGFRSLASRPLCTRTAELICSEIKGSEMRVRNVPGTALAREGGRQGEQIIYTPPVGESILRDLLANWERFMLTELGYDPLVRLAVGHYQFEAIHPFTDGNGRTGRILNSLFLIQEDLLTLPILYLSRYILATKSNYYRLLLGVTQKQAWEPWILYILKGVMETANWTTAKIKAIQSLSTHTQEYVKLSEPKTYRRELIDLIFELPYCRIGSVTTAKIAGRETASRQLKKLVSLGVLEELVVGREKLYLNHKLLKLLQQEGNEFSRYE